MVRFISRRTKTPKREVASNTDYRWGLIRQAMVIHSVYRLGLWVSCASLLAYIVFASASTPPISTSAIKLYVFSSRRLHPLVAFATWAAQSSCVSASVKRVGCHLSGQPAGPSAPTTQSTSLREQLRSHPTPCTKEATETPLNSCKSFCARQTRVACATPRSLLLCETRRAKLSELRLRGPGVFPQYWRYGAEGFSPNPPRTERSPIPCPLS